jgi:tetratricopeptide (TPR) repeat protein
MDLNARNQLISLQKELGFYDEAIEEQVNLAGVYYNLADLSRAREVYLDAYKIAQESGADRELKVKILYHLADIELQSLDWKHAEEIYTQIQSIKPDDHLATEKLIEIRLRLGQDEQAKIEISDYLSFMDVTGDEQSPQDYLDKLVAEYPDRIYLRQKKAELHLKFGQIDRAIQEYDQIGELLLEADDRQGAVDAIEKIIALDPPNKSEYQELIENLSAES